MSRIVYRRTVKEGETRVFLGLVVGLLLGLLFGQLNQAPQYSSGSISGRREGASSCTKAVKLDSVTKVSPNDGNLETPSREALQAYEEDSSFIHHLEWKVLPNYTINKGVSDTTTFIMDNLNLPEISGKTALDIGTVNGCTAFELERQGAKKVYAMDIMDPDHFGFKKLHKMLNSKVTFLQKSLYYLPNFFEADTFDIIIFSGVLYHLRNPMSAVDALYKVLKPGGYLVVETAAVNDPKLDKELVPPNLKYRWVGWCHGDECNNDSTNTFIFTKESLSSFFEGSGFTLKEMFARPNNDNVHRLVAAFTKNSYRGTGYGDVNPDVILPTYDVNTCK